MTSEKFIAVAKNRWVNPRYIIAAVYQEDDKGIWSLSLNLDVPDGVVVPEVYREVRGVYIGNVMHRLGCIPEVDEMGERAK